MSDDVWSALARGCVAFSHTQAGALVVTSFKDSGSLVTSLIPGSTGTAKDRLTQLKKDLSAAGDAFKPITKAIDAEAKKAKDAVANMAKELGTDPFTWEAAARAATELGYVLIALDAALAIIAKESAKSEPNATTRAQIETQIKNIREPWVAPFRSLGAGTTHGFDALCKTVLGIDNAGTKFANQLTWSREQKRLALTLAALGGVGLGTPGPRGATPISLDGTEVEAFFSYKDTAKLGIALRTRMRSGLRGDKMLEKIIPDQAPTANSDSVAIALDTKDGLTFGDGPNRKIVLPVRFNFPGIELREMSIARPVGKDENSGRIDLMVTVAGKLGDVFAVVAEGGGIIIRWKGDADSAVEVLPKPPTAAGLRIKTGIITGGGYLQFKEDAGEYGGVLDLQFTKIGITAAGLITFDPFSLVLVMGVHFLPKIELSWGFTLNGVGGIIALNRALSTVELAKGLQEGALDQLLFPSDPIAAAPKMLERIGKIFPQKDGAVVVGPIAELGWGSQTGFVKAKIGVVLALPDPMLVILGVVSVIVPSPDVPVLLRVVDLHAELMIVFSPDYLLIRVSLVKSKIANMTVSGDIAIFIRWVGGPDLAISIGGFFPKYTPPPEVTGLRPITVEVSPPIPWLTVRAEAYFAITPNSVQFGGRVTLIADLGIVGGKAWLGFDALFIWSPRFYFRFLIDAGIELTAFGETVAGVSFHGELSGMKPWRLEGHASAEILCWDVPFDLGPIEWGDKDPAIVVEISPVQIGAAALREDASWKPQLPIGTDTLARFREDDLVSMLVHPLGSLEVKQLRVPFETDLDRVGSSPVTSRRVHIADPLVGELDAEVVSHATDQFAPGHFKNLTTDQQTSRQSFEEFPCGVRVAASKGAVFGSPTSVTYEWETGYPHEELVRHRSEFAQLDLVSATVLRSNASSTSTRLTTNPYLPPQPDPAPLAVNNAGRVRIVRRDDLSAVAGVTETMTTTAAADRLNDLASQYGDALQLVSA
ncbi:MAG: DUF6603 domain-containing protein [bacterium]